MARETGMWHHQTLTGGVAYHYARSKNPSDGSRQRQVVEVVRSDLAGALDRAITWLDRNVHDDFIVRLLHIPSYLMTLVWLEGEREDLLLPIEAPRRYRNMFERHELIPARELLERLAQLPHIRGLPLRTPPSRVAAIQVRAVRRSGLRPSSAGLSLALLFIGALAVLAIVGPLIGTVSARPYCFLISLGLMTGLIASLGIALGRGPWGIVIDNRNCMSASKLQACSWTILVFSALLIGVAFNLAGADPTPLAIHIPAPLLTAMGISAASLAAAPALLSIKMQQTPSRTAMSLAGIPPMPAGGATAAPNIGALMTNGAVQNAGWTDLVTGDEVGNFNVPDLGKVQQLLVTALLLGVYGVAVVDAFSARTALSALPPLDPSFIWLMGISHASYLAYKAAPHTSLV